MNLGFAGRFTIEKQKVKMGVDGRPLLDKSGNQIKIGKKWVEAEFDNLITNQGLNGLGTGNPLSWFFLSSDNVEPLVTDTNLSGLLGGAMVIGSQTEDGPRSLVAPLFTSTYYYASFAAGVGTGNISKIATGNGSVSSVSSLWSIALVKNGDTPTVISKLPDEILRITYQLKLYVSELDYVGNVTISGVTHEVRVRLARYNEWKDITLANLLRFVNPTTYSGDLGDINSIPSGTTSFTTKWDKIPYVNGSYESGNVFSASIQNSNFPSGIKSMQVSYYDGMKERKYWQVSFSPTIMKKDSDTLIFPPFYIRWGRYVAP